jgi:hypothetical protein
MKLAMLGDVATLLYDRTIGLRHYSTAEEYYKAGIDRVKENRLTNDAVRHIEDGREPFLVDMDAVEMGVHPFIAVYDVMVKPDEVGKVGIVTNSSLMHVGRNTLLAWQ